MVLETRAFVSFCIVWDIEVEDWVVEVSPVSSSTYFKLLCAFLCGLWVHVCVFTVQYQGLGKRTGQQTAQLKKLDYAAQLGSGTQQNKHTNKQTNEKSSLPKFLLAEYCTFWRLQDYLSLQ